MKRQTLLIIDAENLLGELIGLTFDPSQLNVLVADSAKRGRQLMEEHFPDFVLIDPAIPGGLQLLELLAVRLSPDQIIALTASDLMRQMARKVGVEVVDKGGRLSDLVYILCRRLGDGILLRRYGEQVLVVDDDEDLRVTMMRFLESCGYRAIGAGSGVQALLEIEMDDSISVMLLDISMPDMGGLATLREMNKLRRYPLAIMLSGVADKEIARQAIELGAFNYILKPPDLDRVEAAVTACFGRLKYRRGSFWKRSFWSRVTRKRSRKK
jgi:DNA-binding response OmpR family regulator